MVKKLEKIAVVLLIAFFIWIMVSWADVIMHNSPSSGDFNYHSWNAFTMIFEK